MCSGEDWPPRAALSRLHDFPAHRLFCSLYSLYSLILQDLTYPSTVSVALGAVNVDLQNIEPANDYYIIFIDAPAGVTYSVSSKFTITASSDSANGKTVSNKPTASIVGPPSPSETWALRFNSNGNAIGAAAGRPVPVLQWWIGVLGLLGAGAVTLL